MIMVLKVTKNNADVVGLDSIFTMIKIHIPGTCGFNFSLCLYVIIQPRKQERYARDED